MRFVSVLLCLLTAILAQAAEIDELAAQAPLIEPQPDGVLCLNADAAAQILWEGTQPRLMNGLGGPLTLEDGHFTLWAGDTERPYWRIEIKQGGRYQVVINRSTAPGRESSASVSFWQGEIGIRGAEKWRVTSAIDNSGGWDIWTPWIMGEANLPAGEYVVEYRPRSWTSAKYLINLVDIRLIPLEPLNRLGWAFCDLLRKTGVDQDPEIRELTARQTELKGELGRLNALVRHRDFAQFTHYDQFLAYDHGREELGAVQPEAEDVAQRLHATTVAKVKALSELPPEQRATLEEYLAAEAALIEGARRTYPKAHFTPPPDSTAGTPGAGNRRTLFPTGQFDKLPAVNFSRGEEPVVIDARPPPDAAARMTRFQARNGDAGIAALGRELRAAVVPDTPGLEPFEQACEAGDWRGALAAYRAYFFAKLAEPEKYGARTENIFFELTRDRGKAHLLKTPDPATVQLNRHGATMALAGRQVVRAALGEPGAVWWAPTDLAPPDGVEWTRGPRDPFWRTDEGKTLATRIEFYRGLRYLPGDTHEWQSGSGFFPNLLFDYTVNGSTASLDRWCAYLDDFAMNGRSDQENCLLGIREATELETQQVRCMLTLLRIMLDERPALATEFNAATLTRLNLMLVQDYAPYVVRARRAEQANWGIMGICHLLNVASFFDEFKAMHYYRREAWRLWGCNMIQHRTLDGENVEAWDTGHNGVDWAFAIDSWPYGRLAPDVDDLSLAALDDHLRVNERNILVHLTPSGFYWPSWNVKLDLFHNSVRSRYLRSWSGHHMLDLVADEPPARDRIETVMGGGDPAQGGLPAASSDLAPYAAMAYLRGSWRPGAEVLIFQNFGDRSQDLAMCPKTGYSLARGGRYLIELNPLVVDGKPDNRCVGKPRTGGKTSYCAQAGRHVQDMRFLATDPFDYVDGWQDQPYALPELGERGDNFGLYRNDDGGRDPDPITEVKALRQIFHVRGENLWLIADRVEAPAAASHEYTQFVAVPARLPEDGFAERVAMLAAVGHRFVQRDPDGGWIRTDNPGFANVSAWFFAPGPLQVANRVNWRTRDPIVDQRTPLETIQAGLEAGRSWQQIMRTFTRDGDQNCLVYPASVRWTGTGNQAFVTVLASRPAADSLAATATGDPERVEPLAGDDGCLGTHVVTASGAEVWMATGPRRRNALTAGPGSAEAESLLVVNRDGELSGLVIGGSGLTLKGKAYPQTGSFQFVLGAEGQLATTPILCPIDTVRISPDQTVFTDPVRVSFDIPTQDTTDIEYHYTLDGSDPTLASPLYAGPFELRETTRVKVRPFRKGLTETPWNIPGTLAGKTVWATFRKETMRPAVDAATLAPGLAHQYFEGDWLRLFSYAGMDGVLTPVATGTVRALLDPAETATIRRTDRAYAIRYEGFLHVPETGVYTLYAPEHLYDTTMDAGYDLRVWIDGREWLPNPDLHAENTWSIALAKGLHDFRVAYVDYRWEEFRDEYWMSWRAEEMWQGTPALEVRGPNVPRQPIPAAWLRRQGQR